MPVSQPQSEFQNKIIGRKHLHIYQCYAPQFPQRFQGTVLLHYHGGRLPLLPKPVESWGLLCPLP